MSVQIRIAKWGKSLGLRIPRDFAARAGLEEGACVDLETSGNGRVIITRSRRRFTLEELIAEMRPEREHRMDDDNSVGAELI